MRPIGLPVVLLATACVTAENYPVKSANVWCDRLYECDKASFEAGYSDLSDCRETVLDAGEKVFRCLAEECTFDVDKAQSCLRDQASASCEDWAALDFTSDCLDVYSDCDQIDLAFCYAG